MQCDEKVGVEQQETKLQIIGIIIDVILNDAIETKKKKKKKKKKKRKIQNKNSKTKGFNLCIVKQTSIATSSIELF